MGKRVYGLYEVERIKENYTINPYEVKHPDAEMNEEAFIHYRGSGKQLIICLYAELTNLTKNENETF